MPIFASSIVAKTARMSVVMCNYRVKTVVLETRTILLFESCRLCFRQFFLITCFTQIKLNLPYCMSGLRKRLPERLLELLIGKVG